MAWLISTNEEMCKIKFYGASEIVQSNRRIKSGNLELNKDVFEVKPKEVGCASGLQRFNG